MTNRPYRASGVRVRRTRQTEDVSTNPLPPFPKGGGAFREFTGDARKLASEAYALWRDLAAVRANPYGDHSGCLLAGRMAVEAMRWEDGLVILEAIKARINEKSSPRRIPEWARVHGTDQRHNEHKARKQTEKANRDTIIEHQGTLYLGHVPEVIGAACVKCGGDLKAHRLARRPALRHIGEALP